MQLRRPRSFTIGAALILALTAGEARSARPKSKPAGQAAPAAAAAPVDAPTTSDTGSSAEAWAAQAQAAVVGQHINRLRAALPGNERTWFVLVMQDKGSSSKSRRFAIVQGRTAAALTLFAFLSDGRSARKGFQYRAFANPLQAHACCLALMEYSFRTGYR